MRYLLDTNVWIGYLKDPVGPVASKLAEHHSSDIVTCSIVWAELLYGAQKYGNRVRRVELVVSTLSIYTSFPFDTAAAQQYAEIRHQLQSAGNVIGPYDLQIAAISIEHDLTLVTSNTGEFSRIPGLKLVDWLDSSV